MITLKSWFVAFFNLFGLMVFPQSANAIKLPQRQPPKTDEEISPIRLAVRPAPKRPRARHPSRCELLRMERKRQRDARRKMYELRRLGVCA